MINPNELLDLDMNKEFLAQESVWRALIELNGRDDTKLAAVAYVSSDMDIQFSKNDVLITDASTAAIKSGQTSAFVLKRAFDRGALLYSKRNLHAKTIIFGDELIIGSMNISKNSKNTLLENSFRTNDSHLVTAARSFIHKLALDSRLLDAHRLNELLELEVKRTKSSAAIKQLGESHFVFFREVLPGDLNKYNRSSSSASTGGGAMDLRVSPLEKFWPVLQLMFRNPEDIEGVFSGNVVSALADGTIDFSLVKLWRPTDARNSEIRIAKIYKVPGWFVDHKVYELCRANGQLVFYILEMDLSGTVFAKLLTFDQLAQKDTWIRRLLDALVRSRKRNEAIVGALDVSNGFAITKEN